MYNTESLTLLVMYYSLFGVDIINNKKEIIKLFPKKVFGIFTTIRRNNSLKDYPKDVHGCIGYWDNNFNNLEKNTLYNHLLRVSHDSMWLDNRREYFKPIETEPQSILEIDFMLNPIYEINKNNGNIYKLNKKFNNKNFGIIIQTGNKKATYLPNVFPNISWKKLLESIKGKAGIMPDSENFQVFAYKIHQIKSSYLEILTKNSFSHISIMNFSKFLIINKNINSHFLFPYSCENNKLIWNNEEQVRNISILGMIYKYTQIFNNIANKNEIKQIRNKINIILKNLDRYSPQSLSFLGFIYQLDNIQNTQFCNKLISRLNDKNIEKDFELPEIIIGLNKAGCKIIKPFSFTSEDSIFKMNWVIQVIVSYDKIPSDYLIKILEEKINDILLKKQTIETNLIAVAFESLCFVYKSKFKYEKITKSKFKYKKTKSKFKYKKTKSKFKYKKKTKSKENILNKMFELLFELEKRKTCNTLYSFLNKTSRVDITGHVINGLSALILNY